VDAKRIAAEKAAEKISNGMVVGLGSGSTSFFVIQRIGQLVSEGLKIEAVASSTKSEALARQLNIPILPFEKLKTIDIAIDGADEVDKNKNLIKGGGGSLLREKIIAFHSKSFYVIVDESKLVRCQ
jgi:ribose 5-phosphate isomerase A